MTHIQANLVAPKLEIPRATLTSKSVFDNVAVGNGDMPRPFQPQTIAAPSPSSPARPAGSPPAYENPFAGGNSPIEHAPVVDLRRFGGENDMHGGVRGDLNQDVLTFSPKMTRVGEPWAQSPPPEAGFPIRRNPSVESLRGPGEFGAMQQPSDLGDGLGMYGGASGGGPDRADYLAQMDRSNPLDMGRQSPTYQLQHHKDVARQLAPLTQRWDQQAGATIGLRTATGTTPPEALFSPTQKEAAGMTREQAARTVLPERGVSKFELNNLLTRHATSAGGVEVLNACRLLCMPEVKADKTARAALEKRLDDYMDADKGRYTGLYRAFGEDASKPLKKLKASIEETVNLIGRSVAKDRLLADSTAALVDAMARKNPGMSSEALRSKVPELINTQGFSAYSERLDGAAASGLLQDAELLPQLVQAAESPTPAPAKKAAEPVNDFVKHLVSVLGAIKPPHIENNARNIVNQEGWTFQGNKDPRPAPAEEAEVMPATSKELPKLEDEESNVLQATDDTTVSTSDIQEDNTVEADDEEQIVQDSTRNNDLKSTTNRSGMGPYAVDEGVRNYFSEVVNELGKVGFGSKLKKVQVTDDSVPAANLRTDKPVTDNQEDEKDAGSARTAGAPELKSKMPSFGLRRPIPIGQHSEDVPELRKSKNEQA